jgi:hypothetical protein
MPMTTRRLAALLLLIALFGASVHYTVDPDMWWHLRTGELILQNGIPDRDPFSFTVPDNEWIAHEWLSQVFMWTVYALTGLPGLMFVFGILITLSFWLIYRVCDGRPFLATLVVLLAASASVVVFGVRPQVFNLLMTALFVHIIERHRAGDLTGRYMWWLPALTIVWANLHSGFLVGVALLGTYTIGEALDRRLGPAEERGSLNLRQMAVLTGACFLAAGLNPNGPALWIYPFFTLGSPAMQSMIQEWQSPDFHSSVFWPFPVMMAVGVIAWLFSGRRPPAGEILLFLGTAAAGLMSARHIPLFALVAAPIVSRNLLASLSTTRLFPALSGQAPYRRPPAASLVVNWGVLLVALTGIGVWVATRVWENETVIREAYPVAAVDFLERQGLTQARLYNSYNWGGYLIWRGIPVFVDGRADVYGDDFLFYAAKPVGIDEDWTKPLDEFSVEYVLVEAEARLSTLLEASGRWTEVYRDDVARVFGRTHTQ